MPKWLHSRVLRAECGILLSDSPKSRNSKNEDDKTSPVLPFVQAENELLHTRKLLESYQYVSPADDMRKASNEAARLFAEYDVKINSNKDFFVLISAVQGRKETLSTEFQRWVDKLILQFRRRGLGLESADRQHLQRTEVELGELKAAYGENLERGQQGGVWFTESELDGISDKILEKLKTGNGENEGKVFLTFSHAHPYTGLRCLEDSEIRKKYYVANALDWTASKLYKRSSKAKHHVEPPRSLKLDPLCHSAFHHLQKWISCRS
ncbi:MAG: hypothetical protein GOMPHAMPRED_002877 [Gomphillus americanus]|uniref:Uncharacterized protein n=1 Tax=Gomphillus americanus TaxID=1940652 RepID=A0A8H3EKF0_9LECA|nr:MAG: hypothetical protein GOMPHAMPRED_002877 [Gomphillus americanus]